MSINKAKFLQKRKDFSGKTINELLELLSSEDLQTRFLAEMCLRDETGV